MDGWNTTVPDCIDADRNDQILMGIMRLPLKKELGKAGTFEKKTSKKQAIQNTLEFQHRTLSR